MKIYMYIYTICSCLICYKKMFYFVIGRKERSPDLVMLFIFVVRFYG